ncbi:MAG TPA: hypothetical protein VFE24_12295 [Pirellulales bacterium]|jgi:hypothetical protein|nr:hypothetical protein [Pirellulales bacterium]
MKIEIVDEPIQFRLHGLGDFIGKERCSDVGLRLMNQLWKAVKTAQIATTGINHWVYLPAGKLFVGVELRTTPSDPTSVPLESLDFELPRHLRHLHVGPYQELPQTWQALKAELTACGERVCPPSVEIYGHHHDDPSKLETTILIGLETKRI